MCSCSGCCCVQWNRNALVRAGCAGQVTCIRALVGRVRGSVLLVSLHGARVLCRFSIEAMYANGCSQTATKRVVTHVEAAHQCTFSYATTVRSCWSLTSMFKLRAMTVRCCINVLVLAPIDPITLRLRIVRALLKRLFRPSPATSRPLQGKVQHVKTTTTLS